MTLARSRRMLLAAGGLSVAVAVFPATAAHAEQPPAPRPARRPGW